MRPARITPLSLLRAAAVVTVAFSLLTSFPALHYRVELFAHFRLQYLAASVLLLLVFAGLRHSVFGVILLAAASLNAAHVVPWYLGEPAPPTAATLKLLNANVLSHNDDYEALIRLVETEQPDIIFLQEISPAWQAHLAPLGNRYPHGYTEPRSDNFGIALLSRLPLDTIDLLPTPPQDYPTILATLQLEGKALTLINTHSTVPLSRDGFEARNAHLRWVAELANAADGAVILGGDLNTSPWSPIYGEIESKAGLRNAGRGQGILPSWPTFMPFAMIPIDHALVSSDITVLEAKTGSRIGSDHLPLVITIAF